MSSLTETIGEEDDAIRSFRGKYRWLSNFHEVEILTLGKICRNTEIAYHLWKRPDDEAYHQGVMAFRWTADAMNYARTFPISCPSWHERMKFIVMYDLNFQKFSRNVDLREKLLATGDRYLEEGNAWGDKVWGVCDGEGENHLGRILMRIRKELRS